MGDFNIDLYNPSVNAEMFVTSLVCLGMHQLIKTLTRVTPISGSLIDHIQARSQSLMFVGGGAHTCNRSR